MTELIREGERADELELNGLKIIQSKTDYCFTSDAVILANLVKASAKQKVVDLCSGSGIIATLIAAKTKARIINAIELQTRLADSAKRSVELNGLKDRINIICDDAKNASRRLGYGSQDIVVCNPPYYRLGEGVMSENSEIAIARHEVAITLEGIVDISAKLIKFGGKIYIIYRADRLSELLCMMSAKKLEPKILYNIQPAKGKAVDTVVVIAKSGGEKGIVVYNYLRSDLEKALYIKK